MKTDSEILKDKLYEIRNILLELDSLKKDIQSIHNPDEEYFEKIIKKSSFFHRLYLNYIKLFVIDCNKLINEKEDYNVLNLINFCQTNFKNIEWQFKLDKKELESLKDDYYKISKYFSEIALLRNKVYAHNDKKKYEIKYNITLKDLWSVLESLQKIFKKINLHYDKTNWHFEILYKKPTVIKQAHKYLKIREWYFDSYKPNNPIEFSTEEIKKIIRQ